MEETAGWRGRESLRSRVADDGELAIDNNSAERGMRDVAVGRKNWLFTGSPEGGNRADLRKLTPIAR